MDARGFGALDILASDGEVQDELQLLPEEIAHLSRLRKTYVDKIAIASEAAQPFGSRQDICESLTPEIEKGLEEILSVAGFRIYSQNFVRRKFGWGVDGLISRADVKAYLQLDSKQLSELATFLDIEGKKAKAKARTHRMESFQKALAGAPQEKYLLLKDLLGPEWLPKYENERKKLDDLPLPPGGNTSLLQYGDDAWELFGLDAEAKERLAQIRDEQHYLKRRFTSVRGPIDVETMNEELRKNADRMLADLLTPVQKRNAARFFAQQIAMSRGLTGLLQVEAYSQFVGSFEDLELSVRETEWFDARAKYRIAKLQADIEKRAVDKFFVGEARERLFNIYQVPEVSVP